MKIKYLLPILFLFTALSCEDNENNITPPNLPSLTLELEHLMNGSPLQLNTERYTNEVGNQFLVEEFKYYLSNVKLRNRTTGEFFIEPESYHLVSSTSESNIFQIQIENIPVGEYDEIEFAIGVDNAKNLSIDNVGDLDPSNNMAWNWNTGYKFLLLEGRFFPEDGSDPRGLVFHIGSNENFRTLRFPLNVSGSNLTLQEKAKAVLQLETEASQIFTNPNPIDFNEMNDIQFDPRAELFADNYASDMISLKDIVFVVE